MNELTPDQVTDFARDGFLVLESPFVEEPELSWCRHTLLEMMEGGVGRGEGRNLDLLGQIGEQADKTLPTMLQPMLYEPALRNLKVREKGAAIARQLLGTRAEFADDHAIYKPSRRGGVTPWHQDEAFREPGFTYDEISIWVALTDTTVENGAMAYIPGSHRLGVLPHRLLGNSKDANTIECHGGFESGNAVVRPIRAGAMIIHHARTVHGAGENRSPGPRLGYILIYRTPVRMSKTIRSAPWLKGLRSEVRRQRKGAMWRGGIFPEVLRVLKSERRSVAFFWRRRIIRVRRLLTKR